MDTKCQKTSEKKTILNVRKILFLSLLFVVACSPSRDKGVATLSDVNSQVQETEVITEEDYPLILTECLNTKGYDLKTPFDIQDLKSMLQQMTGNEEGKEKGTGERNKIMVDVEKCIQENELWPDKDSANPEEQAKRFDESLEMAQCLRDKGLNVPDPTQENPKLNLSEVDENRETIKEYIEECDPERKTFRQGK